MELLEVVGTVLWYLAVGAGLVFAGFVLIMVVMLISSKGEFMKYLTTKTRKTEESKETIQRKKEQISKRLGRPLIQTNSYEDVIALDVVDPEHIDVEFDSIGGLGSIKESIYNSAILPLKRPELFSHGKLLGPPKGVLLYGPPGTGKTMLAKAIAKESGAVFINVGISNIMNKWFGDAEKLVTAVFSLAHKLEPTIIFIDEVDSLLSQRKSNDSETRSTMKTIFMSLWDGFATDKNAKVMVLAATNRPSELDEAILRRFTRSFEIGMPDRKDRARILKLVLKDERVVKGIDFDRIARLCKGYSGSDLVELCKRAAYLPIQDFLDDEKRGKTSRHKPRRLCQSDLESAIATGTRTNVAAREYNKSRAEKASREIDDNRVQITIHEHQIAL